jgi:hypothetical protein
MYPILWKITEVFQQRWMSSPVEVYVVCEFPYPILEDYGNGYCLLIATLVSRVTFETLRNI